METKSKIWPPNISSRLNHWTPNVSNLHKLFSYFNSWRQKTFRLMIADDTTLISPLDTENNIANQIEETLLSSEDYCNSLNLKINIKQKHQHKLHS